MDNEKIEAPQEETKAPPKPANGTHVPEAGDVGETGEHGDIGSNAA